MSINIKVSQEFKELCDKYKEELKEVLGIDNPTYPEVTAIITKRIANKKLF